MQDKFMKISSRQAENFSHLAKNANKLSVGWSALEFEASSAKKVWREAQIKDGDLWVALNGYVAVS